MNEPLPLPRAPIADALPAAAPTAAPAPSIPADQELGTRRADLATRATALQVVDQASADSAGQLIQDIRGLRKQVAETFDDLIRSAHRHHQDLIARKRKHDDPLAQLETALKTRIGSWTAAVEQRRREEAAAAAAEARRREEDARLAEAAALEAAGEPEAAEQVLEAPSAVPPASAAPVKPKVAGVSTRMVWNVEVTDLRALVRAIASGHLAARIAFVSANETAIKKYIDATAGESIPPGVRAWQTPAVSARGR